MWVECCCFLLVVIRNYNFCVWNLLIFEVEFILKWYEISEVVVIVFGIFGFWNLVYLLVICDGCFWSELGGYVGVMMIWGYF